MIMFSTESSENYLADRRFTMAMQLYERGDCDAALDQRWSYFVGQVGGVFKVESRFNNYAAIA